MPTDFGDIVDYHRQEAERYLALAKTARERGDLGNARYLAGQAARYREAVRQQMILMRQAPGQASARPGPRWGARKTQHTSSAAARLPAVLRSAAWLVAFIGHLLFKRGVPFDGLTLR